MRKLFEQIIKFGIVGVIAFIIDFSVYTFVANFLEWSYLIAGVLGFVISVIANYILSMSFVFERRDDMSRHREMFIFIALSVVGLGINELFLFICMDLVYDHWDWLNGWLPAPLAKIGAKVIATGVVMVYNFVSRKIVLEKKD